ncbi:hypothetical protein K432DRAFT_285070 [Lepidopterella palustris CBS 459.81]|uniref:Uncharacterized protein n=1 Tax=Lepidopterella palustris CBS 459.81 TaxID=1314670 RepID=A0A8E2ELL0_9PEZI|nr:hypothetical protein K432DRAFT_285070 [Lepidopterella palustris CBS 459.81]
MPASRDNRYEQQNDLASEAPTGDISDNDYKSRTGLSEIPVQKDDAPVNDPIHPPPRIRMRRVAYDEKDAIDSSNIINSRTRGAAKTASTYAEPSDKVGMPRPNNRGSGARQ